MQAIGFIAPALFYHDADAAITFLEQAFGFRTRLVSRDDTGRVVHAELTYRDSVIMVSGVRSDRAWVSPRDVTGRHMMLSVVVPDADAHHMQAVEAGAEIVRPPADAGYGGRGYEARDTEGNDWYFGTYMPGAWWDGNTPST